MLEGKIFEPLHDRLLIELFPPKEKEGAIYFPEQAQKIQSWGVVRAVGSEVRNLAKGDEVLVKEHGGTRIVVGGVSHLIAKEREVMAVNQKNVTDIDAPQEKAA